MDDLISRQAAIDYCYALINAENPSDPSDEWNYSQERINQTEVILHHLEVMPPAQPETHEKRTETHACDLISRQAAIEKILGQQPEAHYPQWYARQIEQLPPAPPAQPERTSIQELLDVTADRDYWKAQCHSYEMTINRLTESAQPERIKGRWIPADTQCGIKCSACGLPVDDFCYSIDYIDLDYNPNFCPNCGAEMERGVTT